MLGLRPGEEEGSREGNTSYRGDGRCRSLGISAGKVKGGQLSGAIRLMERYWSRWSVAGLPILWLLGLSYVELEGIF